MLEMSLCKPAISGGIKTKALLHFDQALGIATSTVDECGNTVTPNGINIVAGRFGNGMQLDTSTNAGIILPGSLLKPSEKKPFTIEMNVKVNSFTAGVNLQYFCIGLNDANSGTGLKFQTDGTRAVTIQHYTSPGGGVTMFTSSKLLTAGVFSHIALSSNGTNYYLHIDGVYQGTVAIPVGTDPTRWYLGHHISRSSLILDEIRFSNVARYGAASFTVADAPFELD